MSHKIKSQSIKKSKKNQSRLPRTAGLRTLSELTTELTKAGLDPSRIQERAEMLAKLQGTDRKRKRDEDGDGDVDMDGDEEGSDGADGEGWMDVDGEEAPKKRAKTTSGAVAVIDRRAAKSDRRFAGMRDEGVRVLILRWSDVLSNGIHSKRAVPSNYVTWANGLVICWPRQVKVIVSSKQKWYVLFP